MAFLSSCFCVYDVSAAIKLPSITVNLKQKEKKYFEKKFNASNLNKNQVHNLPNLLKNIPGLHVGNSGGTGQINSIFYRGFRGHHFLCVQDSFLINDPGSYAGQALINNQFFDGTQSVKFITNPRSLLYAQPAVAGVVNIKSNYEKTCNMFFEHSSSGLFNPAFVLSNSTNRFSYRMSAAYLKDEGYKPIVSQYHRQGFNYIPHKYHHNNFDLSTKLNIAPDIALTLSAIHKKSSSDYLNIIQHEYWKAYDNEQHYLSSIKWKKSENHRHNILFSYSNFSRNDIQQMNTSGNTGRQTDYQRLMWEMRLPVSFAKKTKLAYHFQKIVNNKQKPKSDIKKETNQAIAFYQELPVGDKIKLSYAGRFDCKQYVSTKFSYHTQLTYPVDGANLVVNARHARIYRFPTIEERFSQHGSFQGNPNLKPEFATLVELEMYYQKQLSKRTSFSNSTNLFYNTINSMVVSHENSLINQPKTNFKGFETTAQVKYDNYKLGLTYGYVHGRHFNQNKAFKILRQPKHLLGVSFSYQGEGWSIGANLKSTARTHDIDPMNFQNCQVGGYSILTIQANYYPQEICTVFFRIDNLLNRPYETVKGYSGNDFRFFTGMRIKCY